MSQQREPRWFYAIDPRSHAVSHIAVFPTQDPEYYWSPDLGYTLHVGTTLFTTREQAVSVAIQRVDERIVGLQDRRRSLESMQA